MVEREKNGNGIKWTEPTATVNEAHARPLYTGTFQRPLLAGEADVLAVPWRTRLRWGWRSMVRETARQAGVAQGSKLRLVPMLALALTLAIALAGGIASWSLWRGQVNAETAAVKAAAAAADARITASEERLLSAAGRIEHSMETMRAELLGKVEAIQGTVASTQQSMARAEARIEALGKENDRLQVNLDVEEMRRQILENKLRAQGIELD
jgi:hypothetical protein